MTTRREVLQGAAACAVTGWVTTGCAFESPAAAALPEADSAPVTLQRISIGSCADQSKPQPFWNVIGADAPDLHLFCGDNVYSSAPPWQAETLRADYATLAAKPEFARFRQQVRHLAIWDDHDYGSNDGGAEFDHKAEAKAAFLDFWAVPAGDERHGREGLYHARRFGPPGRCVQVLMLDVRWARSPWMPTDHRDAPGKQRYVPTTDTERTLLGETQWQWLAARLADPADVRVIVSGIQVIAEGHGFEHWGLMPHEQQRLLDLIGRTRANGAVLVSGDRHIGGVYRRTQGAPYPITELTSSGLTHAWASANEPGPNRLGDLVRANHYALIDIDWARRRLALRHHDVKGGPPLQQHELALDSLTVPA
ncbi:MAG TPA: alkaline phosphatase D family protein [Ideonella sp.]|uniref:alkaline phosphatase D family protein n=1 Tax=Ideonella sp. TaxID=1929293 RepID=UPI002E32B650|nr:alkaline phosphatase D family protein [Ideonella sp.]HEX5686568.1 alkaline phosphatase D family protein [Ideonella sp.]